MINCLAIDLSYTRTGVAWTVDGVCSWASIKVPTKEGNYRERSALIADQIGTLIARLNPRLVALESPSYNSQNQAYKMGALRAAVEGMIVETMERPLIPIAPKSRAGFATGNGKSEKNEVRQAVRDAVGDQKVNEDEADAIVLVSMVLAKQGMGTPLGPMPPDRARFLRTVRLP